MPVSFRVASRQVRTHLVLRAGASWLLAAFLGLPLGASAQQPAALNTGVIAPALSATLPDSPSSSTEIQSQAFGEQLGRGVLTIGKDELTFIKAPFQPKNLKWDALFVAAVAPLIATDEHVAHATNPA